MGKKKGVGGHEGPPTLWEGDRTIEQSALALDADVSESAFAR